MRFDEYPKCFKQVHVRHGCACCIGTGRGNRLQVLDRGNLKNVLNNIGAKFLNLRDKY
jgi:hypothetical protein